MKHYLNVTEETPITADMVYDYNRLRRRIKRENFERNFKGILATMLAKGDEKTSLVIEPEFAALVRKIAKDDIFATAVDVSIANKLVKMELKPEFKASKESSSSEESGEESEEASE